MALTVTTLDHSYDNVDRTSYTTASVSPAANALILLCCSPRKASTIVPPTSITGNSLTWTQVATINNAGATAVCMTVYSASSASPSTGTIVIDFNSVTQLGCTWSVIQIAPGAGNSASVVQSGTYTNDSTNAPLITLSAFGSSSNIGVGAFVSNINEAQTVGSGFTSAATDNGTTPVASQLTEYKTNDNTVDSSWTTAGICAGVAVEVTETSSAVTGFFFSWN